MTSAKALSNYIHPWLVTEDDGAIRYDSQSGSWLVQSHEVSRHVLSSEDAFARTDTLSESARAVRGNNRSLAVLGGRDHRELHKYLTRHVTVRASQRYRQELIAPIVAKVLDTLDDNTTADIAAQVADKIPIRVGLAMIGFDIGDDEAVAEIKSLKARFTRWSDRDADDPSLTAAAKEAADILKARLMPMVMQRKQHPADDLASEFWRSGPSVFPDWSATDTYAACYAFLGGGETAYALRNALYLLLSRESIRSEVRKSPTRAIPNLTSEALRLFGPIQWLNRVATSDCRVAGMPIQKGQLIRVALPVANRDSHAYPHPGTVDLDEPRRPHHLSFGHGVRYCIGASLALAQMNEVLAAFIAKFPEAMLVGEADIEGHRIRSIPAIHARLTAD